MYKQDLVTSPSTRLTLDSPGAAPSSVSVDLYSREGLETVAALWLKLSAEYRLMYEHTWLGVPIIQLPGDVLAMQELIWRLRPDFIIECGIAHGGSAIFYASLLELAGKGQVIGVDVEIRGYNRAALAAHSLAHRVHLVEASSSDAAAAARVRHMVTGASTVMVVLDSNHTREHVAAELALWSPLVTPGSYLVAMDGAQAHVWDTPRGKPEWRASHPLLALDEFLGSTREFDEDPHYTRAHVTSSPRGFLRRRRLDDAPWQKETAI